MGHSVNNFYFGQKILARNWRVVFFGRNNEIKLKNDDEMTMMLGQTYATSFMIAPNLQICLIEIVNSIF